MFYERNCAKIISDMTQIVVGVGLVTVLASYVRAGLSNEALLSEPGFIVRAVLLVATILFTAYHLLAYAAEFASSSGDTAGSKGARAPLQIVALFVIDLAGLGVMASMYSVLAAPGAGFGDFAITWRALAALGGLAAGWHTLMLIWHAVARSRLSALAAHTAFAALFGLLVCAAIVDGLGYLGRAVWTAMFATIVALLYVTRARRLIRDAIEHPSD